MKRYMRIFNFLWQLKRVEYSLNATWCRHMTAAHVLEVSQPSPLCWSHSPLSSCRLCSVYRRSLFYGGPSIVATCCAQRWCTLSPLWPIMSCLRYASSRATTTTFLCCRTFVTCQLM